MNLVARKKSAACGMGTLFFGERACCSKRPRATVGPSGGLEGYAMWPGGTPKIGMGQAVSPSVYNSIEASIPGPNDGFGNDPSAYEPLATYVPLDLSGDAPGAPITASDLAELAGTNLATGTYGPNYESALIGANGVGITSSGAALTGSGTVNSTGSLVGTIRNAIAALFAPNTPAGIKAVPAASTNPTSTSILPWVIGGAGVLVLLAAASGSRR